MLVFFMFPFDPFSVSMVTSLSYGKQGDSFRFPLALLTLKSLFDLEDFPPRFSLPSPPLETLTSYSAYRPPSKAHVYSGKRGPLAASKGYPVTIFGSFCPLLGAFFIFPYGSRVPFFLSFIQYLRAEAFCRIFFWPADLHFFVHRPIVYSNGFRFLKPFAKVYILSLRISRSIPISSGRGPFFFGQTAGRILLSFPAPCKVFARAWYF